MRLLIFPASLPAFPFSGWSSIERPIRHMGTPFLHPAMERLGGHTGAEGSEKTQQQREQWDSFDHVSLS